MSAPDVPVRVRYHGSPSFAYLFARYLEKEGCRVELPEAEERRDLASAAETVAVALTVWGTKVAIEAAIRKFRDRHSAADIDVDDDDRPGYL